MLFYFSATGNTEHVVEEIKTNGESVVFIPDAIKKGTFDFDVMDNRIGILSPTYFWGLPSIVKDFLEKAHFKYKGKPYCFYVATCGSTPGSSGSIAKDLLKNKNLSLDACFADFSSSDILLFIVTSFSFILLIEGFLFSYLN